MAAAVDRNQRLDLAAVADIDAAVASRLAAGLPSAPQVLTPTELLDDHGLDAVLIVTDAATHYESAVTALTSGRHTFVEKPLAMSSVECADMVQLAASVDRTLMVGHTFLYSDYVGQVKRALDEGMLGELRYVHLQRLAYGRFRDDVNVVWNLGPHDVSILMHWTSRPPQAVRCVEYAFSRPGVSDVAFLSLDFGDFLGHVQLSCVDPQKVRRATVAGTRAGIVYDDVEGEVRLTDNLAGTQRLLSSPGNHRPLDIEIDHFAECIATGKQPKTDGKQGSPVSYSQPDFVVRYRRMKGDRVFYPMGFDDNGLLTERYVEKTYGIRAVDIPRSEFVEMCLAETRKTAARYEDVWRRVGLSVDWSLLYSTIDERCQRTAQASFVKLHAAGRVRRVEDPIIWCPECRTALAQADVEDLERNGKIHDIAFTASEDGRPLAIATTRPELIPACVALYFHPDDERYKDLLGTTAKVPLFNYEVPIKTDEAVNLEFGTGLMMVCTFGDGEDVLKWRRDGLDLRLIVTPDGRLADDAGDFAGLQLTQARAEIGRRLKETGALLETKSLKQNVGVHERCLTPVEYQIRPQWFIGVREHQDVFLARAKELSWIPAHMQRRLEDWIYGLKWDWNISRQRHYGVPFPVWFCDACSDAVLAEITALPVDPLSDSPPVDKCPKCSGSLSPDPDVMDTWVTSSLSPQINDGWATNGTSDPELAPMSLRVQAFEIIRTWLFYTIVQSQFHFDRLPWETVMISGWGLNEQGKKIAKRDLDQSTTEDGFNRYVPDHVIAKYGADALRIWATKARIGTDLRYNEKDIRTGRKFAVKMWNVARFMTMNGWDATTAPDDAAVTTDVDRWMLSHLADAVDEVTAAMDTYDYMQGYQAASRFFWSIYCDRYIEMIKDRFLNPENHTDTERESARAAMGVGLRAVLGMFAPFAPFVTEHLFQKLYMPHEDKVSLHTTTWPEAPAHWRTDRSLIDGMSTVLDQVRVLRSKHKLGANTRLAKVVLHAITDDSKAMATALAESLGVAARANEVTFGEAEHDTGVDGIRVAIFA